MNHFAIGSQRYGSGYIAWLRKPHKANNEIIKQKGGQPVLYPTKDAAEAAAGAAMLAWLNGNMTRDGEVLAANVADAHFNLKPFKKRKAVK